MKKAKITYLLIFISAFYSSAQEIKNDTIVEKGTFSIGKKINNEKEGLWKIYFGYSKNNLILYQEGSYKSNEKTGKWTTYKENKVLKIENFKNDELNGEEIYYYENGKIQSKGNYLNDEPDGEHISYYKSGKVKSIENYSEGTENGQFLNFFENGKIEISGNFINGVEEGEFEHFNKDGKILNKGSFKKGEKIGIWTETEEKKGGLGIPETIRVNTKNYSTNEENIKIYDKLTGKLVRTEYYKDSKLLKSN